MSQVTEKTGDVCQNHFASRLHEAGYKLRAVLGECIQGSFLLVSVCIGCPFGDTRNINPTSHVALLEVKNHK